MKRQCFVGVLGCVCAVISLVTPALATGQSVCRFRSPSRSPSIEDFLTTARDLAKGGAIASRLQVTAQLLSACDRATGIEACRSDVIRLCALSHEDSASSGDGEEEANAASMEAGEPSGPLELPATATCESLELFQTYPLPDRSVSDFLRGLGFEDCVVSEKAGRPSFNLVATLRGMGSALATAVYAAAPDSVALNDETVKLWQKYLGGLLTLPECFQHPDRCSPTLTPEQNAAVRYIWEAIDSTNEARLRGAHQKLKSLQKFAKYCIPLRRRLVNRFPGTPPEFDCHEEPLWQSLADFEGSAGRTGEVLGLVPTSSESGEALQDAILDSARKRVRQLGPLVFAAEGCPMDEIISGTTANRALHYHDCRLSGALDDHTIQTARLLHGFGIGFYTGRHRIAAFEPFAQALELTLQLEKRGGVPTDLSLNLRLDLARLLLSIAREREAIDLAREAYKFARAPTERDTALLLQAEALGVAGRDGEARAHYLKAAALWSGGSPTDQRRRLLRQIWAARTTPDSKLTSLARSRLEKELAQIEHLRDQLGKRTGRWPPGKAELALREAKLRKLLGKNMQSRDIYERVAVAASRGLLPTGEGAIEPAEVTAEYAVELAKQALWQEAERLANSVLGVQPKCDGTNGKPSTIARLLAIQIAARLTKRRSVANLESFWISCTSHAFYDSDSNIERYQLLDGLKLVQGVSAELALTRTASQSDKERAYRSFHLLKVGLSDHTRGTARALVTGEYSPTLQKADPLARVRSTLGPQEAFYEYFTYEDLKKGHQRLMAFHLRDSSDRLEVFDLGTSASIEKLIEGARKKLDSTASAPDVALGKLHSVLLPGKPLGRGVPILFVPVGLLHTLPFESLHDGRTFLGLERAVRYSAHSSNDSGGERRVPSGNALVIGAPHYAGRSMHVAKQRDGSIIRETHWPTLPSLSGAMKEAQAVSVALGNRLTSSLVTGATATEERVRAEINRLHPRILHFATHGVTGSKSADPRNYADSLPQVALALSMRSGNRLYDPSNDGWITETEIPKLLDTTAVDLVVLSACQTGLGSVRTGEELAGMRRAFLLRTETRAVISSLWKVNDAATLEFMTTFYHELSRGMSAAEALLVARKVVGKRFSHPHFWAAFQLYGENIKMRR